MTNIEKLRELTKKALKEKKEKTLEKCVIQQIISKAHKEARDGGNYCVFLIPNKCDMIYIVEHFINEGFEVKTQKQMITIHW